MDVVPRECKAHSKMQSVSSLGAVVEEGMKSWGAEYIGTWTVRKAHSEHAKHALPLGGSGGMPPQESFER